MIKKIKLPYYWVFYKKHIQGFQELEEAIECANKNKGKITTIYENPAEQIKMEI